MSDWFHGRCDCCDRTLIPDAKIEARERAWREACAAVGPKREPTRYVIPEDLALRLAEVSDG